MADPRFTAGIDWRRFTRAVSRTAAALVRGRLILLLTGAMGGCGYPVHFGYKAALEAGTARPEARWSPGPDYGSFEPWLPALLGVRAAHATTPAVSASSVIHLPDLPRPAAAGDIVGVILDSDVRRDARPITFGQVFAPGDLPKGAALIARIGGREVPAQLDVKATHPDGSARMGVVTIVAPSPTEVMLSRGAAANGRPADIADHDDVSIDLDIDGTRHHIDAASALAAAISGGTASYWLRGPLATEARADVPVTDSLHVVFDVRNYSDGSFMTDVQVRNDIAFAAGGRTENYGVTIRHGNDVVLRREKLRQFMYQTWHWPVWSKGDPRVNVVHDPAYMARAGAVHHYDLKTGVRADVIAADTAMLEGPDFDILGPAGITKYMPMTGGRGDIGPLTAWNTIWLVTQNAGAARVALAQADGAGSVPWHMFDRAANDWIKVTKYPTIWNDERAPGNGELRLEPVPDADSGWAVDIAHHPDVAYLPYIMTGQRYYLDQLDAEVSGLLVDDWPVSREQDKAVVTTNLEQLRGRAWLLRDVNECAWIGTDGSAMKAYCQASARASIGYLLAETKRLNAGEAHGWFAQGILPGYGGYIPPWQEDFLASTLILMAEQGNPGANDIVHWQSNFLVGRFLAEARGFHPRNATLYQMIMYTTKEELPFQTWAQIEQEAIRIGFAKDGSVWGNDDSAYNQAALGVLGGMVTVLRSADAKRALAWMRDNAPHSGAADFQKNPTWDIVPAD